MSREVARDIERLCTHWQSARRRFGEGERAAESPMAPDAIREAPSQAASVHADGFSP